LRRFASHGTRRANAGEPRQVAEQAVARAEAAHGLAPCVASIFMRAMSTPVGQSRLQPLQPTQRSSAAATASLASGRGVGASSWPESARRRVLARPRVRCCSSRVTR
jgi:hypothetical protein